MRFGLDEHTINKLIAAFEANPKVDKALVFGSRAKGNYRDDSDIDIAIKGQNITLDNILSMSVAFEDKVINTKVDLLDYNTINEKDLIAHIDRVGIVLYSRWKKYRLEELAKVQTGPFGSQLHMSDYKVSGTPIITVEHLGENKIIHNNLPLVGKEDKERLTKYTLKEGDIVFSRVGSVDRRAYVSKAEDGWMFSGRCLRVRVDNEKTVPKFLSYYFGQESFKETIRMIAVGATMPSINTTILSEVEVLIPPLPDQKAIASILSSLDDKIDFLHLQNKTLEQMAETLFRQWFIEESENSRERKTLGSFVETTIGGEWGKENLEGDYKLQVQCIRGTDIADLETGIPERTPIRFIKQKKFDNIEMIEGDLVMEISGGTDDQSTGRTTYITKDVKALFKYPLVFSNFCRLIRPIRKEYSFFLYSYIHHLYKQGDLFNLENGSSGIKNLNYKALIFELEYRLPVENKVVEFHNLIEPYFYKINKNKIQILSLMSLRDTLLPKLMSGEVRVKFKA